MAITQATMRRYMTIDEVEAKTMQIEDLEKLWYMYLLFKDVRKVEDKSAEVVKTKKIKKLE